MNPKQRAYKQVSILFLGLFIATILFFVTSNSVAAGRQYNTNKLHINSGWDMSNIKVCGTTDGGYSCTPNYSVTGYTKDVTWWFKIHKDYPVKVTFNLVGYGQKSCTVNLSWDYNSYQNQSNTPWSTIKYIGNNRCTVSYGYWY